MRIRRLDVALVFLVATLLYANSLGGPFLYDDIVEIRDNPRVHALSNIPALLVTDFWHAGQGHNPLYRPVNAVVTTLVWVAGGGAPLPFHLLNLLLHAAASSLAFLLLLDLTGSRGASVVGGLLFAAHPVHTEAVAWISGQGELLSALLVLAAWVAHRRGRIGTAAIAAAAGVFAKEGAIVFPALAVAGDLLTGRAVRPRLRSYAAYGAVMAGYLAARFAVLGHLLGSGAAGPPLLNPLRGEPAPDRILTSIVVTGRAVRQSIWPSTLCLDYGFEQIPVARGVADGAVLAGLTIVVAACAAAWLLDRTGPGPGRPAALGASIFAITFLPASNLIFPGISIFAERNLYLPVLGVCLAAGATLAARGAGRSRAAAGIAVAVVLASACGARTVARNTEFSSALDLYTAAARSCPASARAHSFLGIALREAGRPAAAVAAQAAAIAIAPGYADAHAEMGLSLAMTGDTAAAERELSEALGLDPENKEARSNLASLYAATGRPAEALREARLLVRMYPDDPRVLNNYAASLLDAGDAGSVAEATGIYERMTKEHPESPLGPNGLGALHARRGDWPAAADAFAEALRRDPDDLNAIFNRARALSASGRTAEALDLLDRAIASGRTDEGIVGLRRTLEGAAPAR